MKPALSVRQDAASTMAGAIFMSNTTTREQCFQTGVFGLPIEYESFVRNVRKRMPLFLFDHNLRKLYGVFEAASNGGLNVNRDAFQRAYPAQVRVSVIWKCRPLSEDEFSPAIEENYYLPRKFYLDLNYKQVVRLYELFDNKRVEHPIRNRMKTGSLGTQDLSKRAPDKRSLIPNAPRFDDQSHLLIPDISAIVRRYSSHTSQHTVLPPSVEVQPNMTMPLGTENFGAQMTFMHNHHDQAKLPCQSEQLQAALTTTTRHHQLADSRSCPPYPNYPHRILSSGCKVQGPAKGTEFVTNQSYSLSHDFAHNNSIASEYVTQNPVHGDRKHVNTNSTPYALPIPALSVENPQGNAGYQEHCYLCIKQHHLSEGKALPSAESSQQGIPAYPDVPAVRGEAISAVDQQKIGSADYIPLSDCGRNFENASDLSDLENDLGVDMSDQRRKHVIGAESNRKVPQTSVFARISPSEQPLSRDVTGPTLSQLVSSLSQKAKQWSDENGAVADGVSCMIREQVTHRPYSHSEWNLPSQLELEAETGECTESQPPFVNFKRRSEAQNVDTNLGKEISGKVKRRRLVRPSFGGNNASTCSGNCIDERKNYHLKVEGNHFDIDLNTPATVSSDPVEKDNSIVACPSVHTKIQTQKPCEVDANKTNSSNVMETINEQVPPCQNGAPANKLSIDIDISELNTIDEPKMQTILAALKMLDQAFAENSDGSASHSKNK